MVSAGKCAHKRIECSYLYHIVYRFKVTGCLKTDLNTDYLIIVCLQVGIITSCDMYRVILPHAHTVSILAVNMTYFCARYALFFYKPWCR